VDAVSHGGKSVSRRSETFGSSHFDAAGRARRGGLAIRVFRPQHGINPRGRRGADAPSEGPERALDIAPSLVKPAPNGTSDCS
jgi:hypothetical protein